MTDRSLDQAERQSFAHLIFDLEAWEKKKDEIWTVISVLMNIMDEVDEAFGTPDA